MPWPPLRQSVLALALGSVAVSACSDEDDRRATQSAGGSAGAADGGAGAGTGGSLAGSGGGPAGGASGTAGVGGSSGAAAASASGGSSGAGAAGGSGASAGAGGTSGDAGPAGAGGTAGSSDGAPACDPGRSGRAVARPCSAVAPARFDVYTSRSAFETALGATSNVVTFDCIDTSPASPVSIASQAFLSSHSVTIAGGNSGGQYVDESFGYPVDYAPASAPNTFSPGPVVAVNGPAGDPFAEVRFGAGADACVTGFGAAFIDVDYPGLFASRLEAWGAAGAPLHVESGFSGADGEAVFVGVIARDAAGAAVPAIQRVRLYAGNQWPEQSCCEGVVLDDFVFGG